MGGRPQNNQKNMAGPLDIRQPLTQISRGKCQARLIRRPAPRRLYQGLNKGNPEQDAGTGQASTSLLEALTLEAVERLFNKIDRSHPSGCHPWTGAKKIAFRKQATLIAHDRIPPAERARNLTRNSHKRILVTVTVD